MLKAYIYRHSALLVRHWFEVDPTDGTMEHGVRLEYRRLRDHPHRGTESAAQVFEIDTPLWRADLFDRLGTEKGSFSAGHYHPRFDGVEPCERVWDKAVQAAPWAWTLGQFEDMESTLREAAKWDALLATDLEQLRSDGASIVDDAESLSAIHCHSNIECYRQTSDVAEIVRGVVAEVPANSKLDPQYIAPWHGLA
jgi:hypothetical protein